MSHEKWGCELTVKTWLTVKLAVGVGSTCLVLLLILMIGSCGGGATTMQPQSQPSVSIEPTSAIIAADGHQQFMANIAVNWQVNGVMGGSTATGVIFSSGLYTAPEAAVSVTVEAVSQASNSNSAPAGLTVPRPTRLLCVLLRRALLSSMTAAPIPNSLPEEIITSDLQLRSTAAVTQLSTTRHSTSEYRSDASGHGSGSDAN